tara:strand:+ start:2024 stop:3277 length:1254 start_codon:yes stop_codon:yes gene_type:complete
VKIKVLWISPNLLPIPCKKIGHKLNTSGGWVGSFIGNFSNLNNINFHILTINEIAKYKSFCKDNITYHSILTSSGIFSYNKKLSVTLRKKIIDINPDIIDFQGFEFSYSRDFHLIASGFKYVITIQGIISEIYKHYLGGIKIYDIIKNISFKDLLILDTFYYRKYKYYKRGLSEKIAINNCENFIGRTDWDKMIIKSYKNDINYLHFPRKIQSAFCSNIWKIEYLTNNRIFLSQGNLPYKGLHIVLKAISIVKKVIPNIEVIVAGKNLFANKFSLPLLGGYQKYIKMLLHNYDIRDNVSFIGPKASNEYSNLLSQSSLFIQSSFIDNSPNAVIEAQTVGVPIISTFSGGTSSLFPREFNLYYNPSDFRHLSSLIIKILTNPLLAEKISKLNHQHQINVQKDCINTNDLINFYKKIIC